MLAVSAVLAIAAMARVLAVGAVGAVTEIGGVHTFEGWGVSEMDMASACKEREWDNCRGIG